MANCLYFNILFYSILYYLSIRLSLKSPTLPCNCYVALQGRLMQRPSSGYRHNLPIGLQSPPNACPLPTLITSSTNPLQPSKHSAQAFLVTLLQLLRSLTHTISQSAAYLANLANRTHHYPVACGFFRAIASKHGDQSYRMYNRNPLR